MTTIDRFDPFERRIADAIEEIAAARRPDYVDSVLQLTARSRQRPRWAFPERWIPVNRFTIATAAAAAVAVLAGGALLLGRSNGPSVGGPTTPAATSRPSASSTTGGTDLPSTLVGRWLGETRPALAAGGGGADLLITATDLVVSQGDATRIFHTSSAAKVVDGQLRMTNGSGCAANDQGTYTWFLTPSGQTLTIAAVQDPLDPCAQRRGAMAGTWWRMDCHAEGDFCLGLLDPGTYGSRAFAALDPGQVGRFGGLTFTVPDGWANDGDWPGNFTLWPAADYAATTTDSPDPAAQLQVMAKVSAESQAKPCSNAIQAGVDHTPAALIAWLRSVAGLQVSASTPLTVDGHPALSVDVSVPKAPAATCDGGAAVVEYLVSDAGNGELITNGILAGERQRLIVFQVNGVLTAIVIHVHDASRFDAFVQQAMPVVDSFRFR